MKIIKQKTPYDCALASIAMLAGKPYGKLWSKGFRARIEEKQQTCGEDLDFAFSRAGFNDTNLIRICMQRVNEYDRPDVLKWRRGVIQLPSLNQPNTDHLVYWDGEKIYDPSPKQIYLFPKQLRQAVWAWLVKP